MGKRTLNDLEERMDILEGMIGTSVKSYKERPGDWVPIFQTMAEDFDEALGAYTGAQSLIEMQQNTVTKEVRFVKIER